MAHEQIWAPWRLGYIIGDKKEPLPDEPLEWLDGADYDCFLCQCAVATDDRRRLVVERTEHTVVILNRYPYNNGHLLVAPHRHRARLDELDADVQLAVSQAIGRMIGLLEKVLQPEGFNVGFNQGLVAGAGLPGHLHWHIVPRWNGDTSFMSSLAGIRVVPQSLEALWEALTSEIT